MSSGVYTNGSRRSSFNSDMDMLSASDVEIHSEISEISSQVNRIQQTLSALEEHHMDDKHIRLKQDNAVLQERIHMLEESLQASEERWKEKLTDERSRHKDLIARVERETALASEAHSLKLQLLTKEHDGCTELQGKLQSTIDTLSASNASQAERIEILELQLNDLTKDANDASGMLTTTRKNAQQQVAQYQSMIEELQDQVETLKSEGQSGRQSSALLERSSELEKELEILREEKAHLTTQNENLHSQLLQASVETGRSLLAREPGNLADELDSMSKDQVMEALKEQEMVNQKLRTYVDGILIKIIEMHPAILEIQTDEPPC